MLAMVVGSMAAGGCGGHALAALCTHARAHARLGSSVHEDELATSVAHALRSENDGHLTSRCVPPCLPASPPRLAGSPAHASWCQLSQLSQWLAVCVDGAPPHSGSTPPMLAKGLAMQGGLTGTMPSPASTPKRIGMVSSPPASTVPSRTEPAVDRAIDEQLSLALATTHAYGRANSGRACVT